MQLTVSKRLSTSFHKFGNVFPTPLSPGPVGEGAAAGHPSMSARVDDGCCSALGCGGQLQKSYFQAIVNKQLNLNP